MTNQADSAVAQLMEIVGLSARIQSAVLRGATSQQVEAMRSEAHDRLDGYLDVSVGLAAQVRGKLKT